MSTLLELSPSIQADEDPLVLYGQALPSRLMLGTARYPSPAILEQAVARAQPCLLTVSLRRQGALGPEALSGVLGPAAEAGDPTFAQHRRLPQRARGDNDGGDGPRGVWHRLDQAGADWR
jgi:hypothetical protein